MIIIFSKKTHAPLQAVLMYCLGLERAVPVAQETKKPSSKRQPPCFFVKKLLTTNFVVLAFYWITLLESA